MHNLHAPSPSLQTVERLGRARFLPVTTDCMAPTLRLGVDFMAVLPCDRYIAPNVYLLDVGGALVPWRVEHVPREGFRLTFDSPEYANVTTMTPAQFADAVAGYLFAVLRDVDHGALAVLA